MSFSVTFAELANIAIPQCGVVNFKALHLLIQGILDHIQIAGLKKVLSGEEDFLQTSQVVFMPREGEAQPAIINPMKRLSNVFDNVVERINKIESQVSMMTGMPSTTQVLEASQGTNRPAEEIWNFIKLLKKVEGNEEALAKFMKMLQDLLTDLHVLKHTVETLQKDVDMMKYIFEKVNPERMELVCEDLKTQNRKLSALQREVVALQDRVQSVPQPEDMVLWSNLHEAMFTEEPPKLDLSTTWQSVTSPPEPILGQFEDGAIPFQTVVHFEVPEALEQRERAQAVEFSGPQVQISMSESGTGPAFGPGNVPGPSGRPGFIPAPWSRPGLVAPGAWPLPPRGWPGANAWPMWNMGTFHPSLGPFGPRGQMYRAPLPNMEVVSSWPQPPPQHLGPKTGIHRLPDLEESRDEDQYEYIGESEEEIPKDGAPQEEILKDRMPQHRVLKDGTPTHGALKDGTPTHGALKDGTPTHGALKDGTPTHGALKDGTPTHGALKDGTPTHGALKDGTPTHGALKDGTPTHGALKDGTPTHGALKDGTPTHGALKDGTPTHGALKDGTPTHGALKDGTPTHGALKDGTPTHGALKDGTPTHGALKDGTPTHGALKDGTPTHGALKDGTPTHGALKDGTPTHGALKDGTPTHGALKDGTPTHGALKDGTHMHRGLKDKTTMHGASKDGTTMHGVSQDGTPMPRASQDGTATPRASQDGTPMHRASQDGIPTPRASQDGTPTHRASQDGTPMHRASQDGTPMHRASIDETPKDMVHKDRAGKVSSSALKKLRSAVAIAAAYAAAANAAAQAARIAAKAVKDVPETEMASLASTIAAAGPLGAFEDYLGAGFSHGATSVMPFSDDELEDFPEEFIPIIHSMTPKSVLSQAMMTAMQAVSPEEKKKAVQYSMSHIAQIPLRHDSLKEEVAHLSTNLNQRLNYLANMGSSGKLGNTVAVLEEKICSLQKARLQEEELERIWGHQIDTMKNHYMVLNRMMERLQIRMDDFKTLKEEIQRLDLIKADKTTMDQKLKEKADRDALASKANRTDLEVVALELNEMAQSMLLKITTQESDWKKSLKHLRKDLSTKLVHSDLNGLKRDIEEVWKVVRKLLIEGLRFDPDSAAGFKKKLFERVKCISCERPVEMMTGPQLITIRNTGGLSQIRPASANSFEYLQRQLMREQQQQLHFRNFGVQKAGLGSQKDWGDGPRNETTFKRKSHDLSTIYPYGDPELIDYDTAEVDILGVDGVLYKGRMSSQFVTRIGEKDLAAMKVSCTSVQSISDRVRSGSILAPVYPPLGSHSSNSSSSSSNSSVSSPHSATIVAQSPSLPPVLPPLIPLSRDPQEAPGSTRHSK